MSPPAEELGEADEPDEADEVDESYEMDEPYEDEPYELDEPHDVDDLPAPAPDPLVEGVPTAEEPYVPTAEDEALARRTLAFLEDLASAIASNADSCDRMADALQLLLSRNRDLIATAKSMDGQAQRSRWLEKQLEAAAGAMINRIAAPLQRCMESERLKSVIESNFG